MLLWEPCFSSAFEFSFCKSLDRMSLYALSLSRTFSFSLIFFSSGSGPWTVSLKYYENDSTLFSDSNCIYGIIVDLDLVWNGWKEASLGIGIVFLCSSSKPFRSLSYSAESMISKFCSLTSISSKDKSSFCNVCICVKSWVRFLIFRLGKFKGFSNFCLL